MYVTPTLDLGGLSTATDLPIDAIDPLIGLSKGGTLLDIDLEVDGYSYPASTSPANGAPILDLTEVSARNSVVTLAGSGAITRAGNGFDFSNVVNPGQRIEAPASISTSIWSTGQLYLAILYLRLPTQAQWPTSTNYTRPVPIITFVTNGGGFVSEADLFSINYSTTSFQLRAVRPTAGTSTFDTFDLTPAAGDYGAVVQLALWRSAAGQAFRLKSPRGTVSAGRQVGANNATDVSGKKLQIGTGPAVWKNSTTEGKTMRLYRAYIENLAISGRNPQSVADEDYFNTFGLRGLPFS